MNARILLIEDEPRMVRMLRDRLVGEGYLVEAALDGEIGLEQATRESFDLIILDVMLPRRNGFDVCRDLRQRGVNTPIIMLTARTQVSNCVVGLKLGADDYVTKPFKQAELLARIEAQIRRSFSPREPGTYHFGSVRVDCHYAKVEREGMPLELSAREIRLPLLFS